MECTTQIHNIQSIIFYSFRMHSFLPYYYCIRGNCKDGFTYVLYINGGHAPYSLLYPFQFYFNNNAMEEQQLNTKFHFRLIFSLTTQHRSFKKLVFITTKNRWCVYMDWKSNYRCISMAEASDILSFQFCNLT